MTLPPVFGDHMVLQQGSTLPIWGKAAPGEVVRVTFAKQKVQTFAAKDGNWRVTLRPIPASETPGALLIEGKNKIEIQDVLMGDVWICAGEGNMQFPLTNAVGGKTELGEGSDESLRFFSSQNAGLRAGYPISHGWVVSTPESAAAFSAVGYFFARDLRKTTQLPIGMIQCTTSDAQIQSWISRNGLSTAPPFARFLSESSRDRSDLRARSARFQELISPFIPYAFTGVIWYQGESATGKAALEYRRFFPRLIRDWRTLWKQGPFPFYFVLPAGFGEEGESVVESYFDSHHHPRQALPWLREAAECALTLPNTGMAVATDLGIPDERQPSDKLDVGRRLALLARRRVYGEKIVDSGPSYASKQVEGAKLRVFFNDVGSGLTLAASPVQSGDASSPILTHVTGFALAGVDGEWFPAKGVIDGKSVLLSSDAVSHPLEARFNWKGFPNGNLYNKEGLPASPFRTDVAQPK